MQFRRSDGFVSLRRRRRRKFSYRTPVLRTARYERSRVQSSRSVVRKQRPRAGIHGVYLNLGENESPLLSVPPPPPPHTHTHPPLKTAPYSAPRARIVVRDFRDVSRVIVNYFIVLSYDRCGETRRYIDNFILNSRAVRIT